MPLELGLFLGAKRYGHDAQRDKRCLIMDSERYRYQQFISDIGGQDVKAHGNDKKTCIRVVRDWLNDASGRKTLPGGNAIHEHYLAFEQDLPKLCRKLKIEKEELTYNDFAEIASSWLEAMNS